MLTPVVQLPPDRLAGLRPSPRPDARPSERDHGTAGQSDGAAGSSFEALARSGGQTSAIVRLAEHSTHRRAGRQLEADAEAARDSSNAEKSHALRAEESAAPRQPGTPTSTRPHTRYANPAFQAQVIAQELFGVEQAGRMRTEPSNDRRTAANRHAEYASDAYRRHFGETDSAPLIEPHQAIDLVL